MGFFFFKCKMLCVWHFILSTLLTVEEREIFKTQSLLSRKLFSQGDYKRCTNNMRYEAKDDIEVYNNLR